MPIDRNAFDRFRNTEAATRIGLQSMGLAALDVIQKKSPKVTGNLIRSHRMLVNGDSVKIGVTADYGAYVHNGTSRNKKAQPWIREAAQANRNSIAQAGIDAFEGALR